MFIRIASLILNLLLRFRYRIRVHGLDEIIKKKGGSILFLPNHPALIDPSIVSSVLLKRFRPYILVAEDQVAQTPLRHLVKQLHILAIPDLQLVGRSGFAAVQESLKKCLETLKNGNNLLLYPSGHVYRSRYENLRGAFGAYYLIKENPSIRVVLIRTTGLWGSSFSRANGVPRSFNETFIRNVKTVFRNLLFFTPRRTVDLTFEEPGQIPHSSKDELNRFLEAYYNADAPGNTYVPYLFWEKGGTRILPEPVSSETKVNTGDIPDDVRKKVFAKLREVSGITEIQEQSKLGSDLSMDSLMISEMIVWIQEEFGYVAGNPESIRKVADLMLTAVGRAPNAVPLKPVPAPWFIQSRTDELAVPDDCKKITESFLKFAAEQPDFPLLADQNSGVLSNRRIILSILALKHAIEELPGERVGLIMPSCAPFFVIFMATLFAGKTPVLLNWTVGPRNLAACVKNSGIQAVLSSKIVIEQLSGRGTDFTAVADKLVYLEDLSKKISVWRKLAALFQTYCCWHSLRTAEVRDEVAVLFTSGSESEPKAVPLTHENCITDLKYALKPLHLHKDEAILGMLPPFHSFGLLIGGILPAASNMRIVYHSNPTEGGLLARLIHAYQATVLVGTPTFANGILQQATQEQVRTLRFIVTGAERCPKPVFDLVREKCPSACFLEGYGITECSPIVSLNHPGAAKENTIGHIIETLDWMICDDDWNKLPPHQTGMLYVSGPTVFKGYLNFNGPSPFVERDGKSWYRTGDLVQMDDDGYLVFKGRLKRFIKVAGEMVSLPAVEEALMEKYGKGVEGVPLAIEAQGPDHAPEIILFTTLDLEKNDVNQTIREAGFSAIHYVKKVVKMDEIPLLGTGKTDYRKLKSLKTA